MIGFSWNLANRQITDHKTVYCVSEGEVFGLGLELSHTSASISFTECRLCAVNPADLRCIHTGCDARRGAAPCGAADVLSYALHRIVMPHGAVWRRTVPHPVCINL